MKLYSYFRSSASYRVRIALNLKGLPYETVPVHLLNNGGEQLSEQYRGINPDGLVPALDDDGAVLTQSLAIIEYLEETHPQLPLLPLEAQARAYVRAVALAIACDIHPVNNLRILKYLTKTLQVDENAKNAWYRHWCEQGLGALEKLVAGSGRAGRFVLGDTPTLADCFLVPQIFNAQRFDCDLSAMPTLMRINDACLALPAFADAAPARQPDAS